jgi:hypothetical protein
LTAAPTQRGRLNGSQPGGRRTRWLIGAETRPIVVIRSCATLGGTEHQRGFFSFAPTRRAPRGPFIGPRRFGSVPVVAGANQRLSTA